MVPVNIKRRPLRSNSFFVEILSGWEHWQPRGLCSLFGLGRNAYVAI